MKRSWQQKAGSGGDISERRSAAGSRAQGPGELATRSHSQPGISAPAPTRADPRTPGC